MDSELRRRNDRIPTQCAEDEVGRSVVVVVVGLADTGIVVVDVVADDVEEVVDGSRDTRRKKERVVDDGNENGIVDTDDVAVVDDMLRWCSNLSSSVERS